MSRFARTGWLAVALTFVLAQFSCGGSSWDAAVDRANEAGQPLIIEFYAEWCGPCHRFEEQVLGDPAVAKRLESVQFFRYDFDSTAGKYHAKRLGVNAVPTIIAVDPEGFPMGGLRGAVAREKFLHFLDWAQAERERLLAGG